MWSSALRLWKSTSGAVAPTIALSLFGLIAAGGIAFDYAHMAALDTELQDAADQAALAAATQLDGASDSSARATAAAQSLLNNTTSFASDDSDDDNNPRKVTIATVNFYQSYDDATDTFGDPADPAKGGADARVVEVVVGGRKADFALTPIVGALTSGTLSARAAASLGSAICNVPPLMMCVPSSGTFPSAADAGRGLRLQPGPQTGAWAPGDYGYLDFANGASGLATNLGRNNQAAGCVNNSNGIPTEPGNKASVTDALNSRFDLYPASSAACNAATGDFCPAQNTRKDEVMTEQVDITQSKSLAPPGAAGNPGCGAAGAKVISKSNSTDANGFVQSTDANGFTRDTCHIGTGCTGGNFGDGNWDRTGYFAKLHSGALATAATWAGKSSTATTGPTALNRYDVYKWELSNTGTLLKTQQTDTTDYNSSSRNYYRKDKGANSTYTYTNQCAYPFPKNGTGVAPGANQKDRRVLTVAAVDCTGLNGKGNVTVKNWVDMFLVEPSLNRTTPYTTGQSQIYGEIIGVTKKPNGNTAFQYYLRQRPRLIR